MAHYSKKRTTHSEDWDNEMKLEAQQDAKELVEMAKRDHEIPQWYDEDPSEVYQSPYKIAR